MRIHNHRVEAVFHCQFFQLPRDATGGNAFPIHVRGKGNFVAETTRIQEKSREDFRKEFLELVKKGLQTGVAEEEMLSLVRKSCEEEQR